MSAAPTRRAPGGSRCALGSRTPSGAAQGPQAAGTEAASSLLAGAQAAARERGGAGRGGGGARAGPINPAPRRRSARTGPRTWVRAFAVPSPSPGRSARCQLYRTLYGPAPPTLTATSMDGSYAQFTGGKTESRSGEVEELGLEGRTTEPPHLSDVSSALSFTICEMGMQSGRRGPTSYCNCEYTPTLTTTPEPPGRSVGSNRVQIQGEQPPLEKAEYLPHMDPGPRGGT